MKNIYLLALSANLLSSNKMRSLNPTISSYPGRNSSMAPEKHNQHAEDEIMIWSLRNSLSKT